MKKIIFATLAATALVACAKEEPIALDKEPIKFNSDFVDGSVRSIDPSIQNAAGVVEFKVYGTIKGDETGSETVNIYDGVDVANNIAVGVGDGWKYAIEYVQYWIDGDTYDFAAVVNGGVVTTNGVGMPATITYTADGKTDLLYAQNHYGVYTKGASETQVPFTFNHLLSKVKFTVKNTIATNSAHQAYTYKVSDVKITNAYASGTYTVAEDDITNGTWGTTPTGNFETKFGNIDTAVGSETPFVSTNESDAYVYAINGNAKAESHDERLLIPGTKDLNIKATIQLFLNNKQVDVIDYDKNVTVPLAKGTAYNFVIELGKPGDEIKFTVNKVNDWTPAGADVVAPAYPVVPQP